MKTFIPFFGGLAIWFCLAVSTLSTLARLGDLPGPRQLEPRVRSAPPRV